MCASIDVRKLPGAREVTLVREAGYFPVLALLGEREVHPSSGEVVAVLRGGAGHVGIEGRLELVRSRDGGATWLPPSVIVDSDWDDRNPAVGIAPDGAVIVAYLHCNCYDEQGHWDPCVGVTQTLVVRSRDGGHSWEPPHPLGFQPLDGRSPYGRMIVFPDGTLGMAIYGARIGDETRGSAARSHSYLLRSTDGGRTWGDPSLVGAGFDETAFLRCPEGTLIAALRTEAPKPVSASVSVSTSLDDGRTWSAAIPVTDAGEHPADLTLLGNGWVLLTYGHRHEPFGVQGMVSRDRGHSWERERKLVFNDDRPGFDCGYPSTVRFPDGTLLTVYYSAGDHMHPYRLEGTFAAGVLYPEATLIAALA
jgi:hypothetical protein